MLGAARGIRLARLKGRRPIASDHRGHILARNVAKADAIAALKGLGRDDSLVRVISAVVN
jgi:hypothetical protein